MLRVWKASGEELVAISGKELKTVRALKKQLQGYCGLPRFRQRLLLDGRNLEDDESLDFPTDRDLQLVMLILVSTCDLQAEILDAISNGRVEEVERLLQVPLDPNAGHLLLRGARNTKIEIMQLLLEAQADPNGNGSEQPWTPLCQAVLQHQLTAVQCLLTAGACIERTGILGTPLCLSALIPQSDVMSVLLESRANTEAQTDAGATPLLLATESLNPKASMDAATVLVEAGAVVDSTDKSGRTPLWIACSRGHVRVVRLLLKAGARPSMRDSRGKTPFDAAWGRKHVRRLLSNAKWSRAPHVKARSRHWENWACEAEKCVTDMKAAREEADGLLLEHTQGPVKARWLTSEISRQIADREVARQEKLIREAEKEKSQHEQALAKLERQKREGKKNQNAIHNEKDKGKQVARKIANLTTDLQHLQEQAAAAANQCAALQALAVRHLGNAATLEGVEAEIERSYGSKDLLDQEFESDDWSEAASSSEDLMGWANMNASGARSSDSAGSTALAKQSDMAKVVEDIEKKWRKELSATEHKCAEQQMQIDRLEAMLQQLQQEKSTGAGIGLGLKCRIDRSLSSFTMVDQPKFMGGREFVEAHVSPVCSDPKSPTSGSFGAPEGSDEGQAQAVDGNMTEMLAEIVGDLEFTDKDLLRAVPACRALHGFGRMLRRHSIDPSKLYNTSERVDRINEFWSHSWRAPVFWKVWFLLMLKNGKAACIVGSIVAFFMAWLTYIEALPGLYFMPLNTRPGFEMEQLGSN
ncbi:ASB3 [Symbiodinium sp. CCMP2456]|nr:ASB3 [Symbiodinium sp. CCMP2456]